MQTSALNPHVVRRWLVLTLVGGTVALNLPIVLPDDEGKVFFGNWILNGTATAAFAMAGIVSIRQGRSGLYGRAQAAFAIALGLWLGGELLWTYYELGLGIDAPFPSLADALWLAGYAMAAYFLYSIYRFFGKGQTKLLVVASMATIAFVAYTDTGIVGVAADLEADAFSLLVSLLYVVVDAALIIPAIMVLSRLKRGKFTGMPWFLLSISMLLFATGDVGFAYHSATDM